jgi:hypothetical protein
MRKTAITLAAVVAVVGTTLAAGLSPAAATMPPDHKVTICHATNSVTNPYVEITVDIASSGYLRAGHADHTGPVPTSPDDLATFKADGVHWGDVIPAYTYGDFSYPGLNTSDAGLALLESGCLVPDQPPATVKYRIVRRMPLESRSVVAEAGLVPSISCDGTNYTISFSDGTVVMMEVGTSRKGSILRVRSEGELLVKVRQAEVC